MSADKKTPGVYLCARGFLPACAHACARALVRPPASWREGFPLAFFFSIRVPKDLGEGSVSFAALAVSGRGPTFSVSCGFLFLSSALRCLPPCWPRCPPPCWPRCPPPCWPRCLPPCWLRCPPPCWLRCLPPCWPRCRFAGLDAGLLASMPACWPRCRLAGLGACLWRAWSNGIIRRDFFCLISFLYIVFLVVGFRIVVLSLCL